MFELEIGIKLRFSKIGAFAFRVYETNVSIRCSLSDL